MTRRFVVLAIAMAFAMTTFVTGVSARVQPDSAEMPAVEATDATGTVTCTVETDCSWEQWVRAIQGTYDMIGEICGDAGGYAFLECIGDLVVAQLHCVE